jgi:subtilisin family serine protease
MRFSRRLGLAVLSVLLVAVLGVAAGSAAKPKFSASEAVSIDSTFVTAKSVSGALAQTDPALLGRTDATPINVVIKYDYDATASYKGGISGLAATSPSVTGKKLKDNKDAVRAYEDKTARLSDEISAGVQQAVPSTKIRTTFQTVYGGVEAQIPANSVADVLKVPGVAAVQADTLERPLDDNTQFIGAAAVWPSLGGSASAGSNVTVGVIDSGVWPEHPMVSPSGISAPAGGLKGCQFGDGSDSAHLGAPFACNNKLIGAYAKTATYMAAVGASSNEFCNNTTHVCSPRDSEGHGTHTLTTAAGDCVTSAVLYGVERGPVCGIAPGAHVIAYRVCLSQGCFGSDSVAAVQQAILDGVDVINFSISGGGNPYTDAVELAFLDAFNAGISVNASAGNSGPGAATSDHGGPWVTTVGASTGPRSFASTLHLTADGGASLDVPGVTLTNGISPATSVVMAATLPGEDAACRSTLPAGTAPGKIVVCARGGNGRIDKGRRVLAGGAAGMILFNQSAAVTDLESDNHYLPAIQTQYDSDSIANFVTTHANVKATWAQGTATPATPDVMASFSSRGPLGDFIKPDVTAPGVQVLAGTTPQPDQTTADNGPVGNLYMAIAGTSMSSPHSAGVSALVKSAHPDWTPAMIKSALMTSSVQTVVKEDGVTPADPFDMGAGSIRADRAVSPTLVFDETTAEYVASATDPLHRIDLNIASVDEPTMTGWITTKRVATNVSGEDQDLEVSTVAPDGSQIIVTDKKPKNPHKDGKPADLPRSDNKIHLRKNGTTDIWITISAPELPNGHQYFGRITLDPKKKDANPVTIPVAFVKKQGIVTLSHTCAPTTIPQKTGVSNCAATVANLGSVEANVGLTVTNLDKRKGLDFTNILAPASSIKKDDGVQWSGVLTPALPPTVDTIGDVTGNGPAGGSLPLPLIGPPAVTIPTGDDAITNVNVPTFYYGGEPYSKIGVVTNGYVVLGGGTASDVNYLPQTFPDVSRPNNVVAPFWTDLNTNPATLGSGTIFVSTLTDGTDNWIVVDFEAVKNFSNSTTHTGEIWIQYGDSSTERVTVSYGPGPYDPSAGSGNAAAGDPGSAMNWGAENRDGTSGKNLASAPANNAEWSPSLSPPSAGGIATITYDASSKKEGTYKSVAGMTSDVTAGTTQEVQTLIVTKH